MSNKKTRRLIISSIIALTIQLNLFAQQDQLDQLLNSFDQYRATHFSEKVYLHTDKSFYLSGEIIWFKAYNVDASFNRPIDMSKIVYVELMSREDKAILQAKVEMINGTGTGSLIIPASIGSGNYTLRAYTAWMKNSGPNLFYHKSLGIINPSRYTTPTMHPAETSSFILKLFPEGGNLVYDLESRIAFKVTNQYGQPVDGRGVVINQRNDTIARFNTLKFGLGNFILKPKSGDSYRVQVITSAGSVVTSELPGIFDAGHTMQLKEEGNENLLVSVNVKGLQAEKLVYLIVHSRNSIRLAKVQNLQNGIATFALNRNELKGGISHFTIFNSNKQAVCERVYFKRPDLLQFSLKTNQSVYDLRQKVEVQADAHNLDGKLNLSTAVYLLDSIQRIPDSDIAGTFWLASDLVGKIDSISYYMYAEGPELKEATDNLMLTHGWRRFKWEEVLSRKNQEFDFTPELGGHIVSARVVNKSTGLPVSGITAYISVPAERYHFNNALSDKNGVVKFNMNNFYGANEIVVSTNPLKDSMYRVDILNPFSDKISKPYSSSNSVLNQNADQLLRRYVGVQVETVFSGDKRNQFTLNRIPDSTAFYGLPTHKYFLDDYTRFSTMDEVLREYVAEVQVKKSQDDYVLRALNLPYKVFFQNNPLVLIDGVPLFDMTKVLSIDPLKIKKLEVVANKYYLGGATYSGIVSYSTYNGDLGGFQLDPGSIILSYEGMQLQREFYSPVYSTTAEKQSRLPDFRNTLYWSGNLLPDQEGKTRFNFFTSDLPGRYAVVVEGLSSDGKAGSGIVTFEVKKKD